MLCQVGLKPTIAMLLGLGPSRQMQDMGSFTSAMEQVRCVAVSLRSASAPHTPNPGPTCAGTGPTHRRRNSGAAGSRAGRRCRVRALRAGRHACSSCACLQRLQAHS